MSPSERQPPDHEEPARTEPGSFLSRETGLPDETPGLPDPFPGEYRFLEKLGRGAFGEVWLAEDLGLGLLVALKMLREADSKVINRAALIALQNEARLLASLSHPNIVRVHALRSSGAQRFLVLQYVSGGSLAERLRKEGPLSWQQAARYIADVGEGLLAVHLSGIIHRDIKPGNILLDPRGDEACLTDFGVSARLGSVSTSAGTMGFMPPEAFDGAITPAVDVFSLAATLFNLITREVPFPARSRAELKAMMLQGLAPMDPRFQGMPEPLERLIRDGVALEPGKRPSVREFILSLRASLNLLLADTLVQEVPGAPVQLRLVVQRVADGRPGESVAATEPSPSRGQFRDLKRVPQPPRLVSLKTGDRVHVEMTADRPGYLIAFNVGPTGNLTLLYPSDPHTAIQAGPVAAGQAIQVVDVEVTPPAGRERLFALWSRQPPPLALDQLASLAEDVGASVSPSYRATRDMLHVQRSLKSLPREDWHAVVLELEHRPV